ncbi:MAG: glycosyltransferase family 4 protein, partial [Thermomicrobium sp.]|nr:glycosyltransferase family 4 protein [Thermomicrobium sp.]
VIPHGVDDQFFPRPAAEREAVRRRYGLHRPFVLHVGTIQPRKNVLRVVRAFEMLASKDPELELVLAGKRGWLAAPIEEAIATSPFRSRIHWLGHVDDRDLPALYSAAAVFVFPSLYEGFGLPVLEAMACGVPVVTSRRGSLAEIAGPALVCDPLDVADIARAIETARLPAARETLIAAGRTHAARFTWTYTAQQTLAVLCEVLGVSDADAFRADSGHQDR